MLIDGMKVERKTKNRNCWRFTNDEIEEYVLLQSSLGFYWML